MDVECPVFFFFFFKQKTAYEMRISDWSSDVCSSDLARDGLNPRTAHADAGALRIDALVLGANGDLGPRTRITRRPHDLNEAFGDFWHFDAEQLDQHLRRSTRQNQLRAAVLSATFLEQCANTGTAAAHFTRNDLYPGQQ